MFFKFRKTWYFTVEYRFFSIPKHDTASKVKIRMGGQKLHLGYENFLIVLKENFGLFSGPVAFFFSIWKLTTLTVFWIYVKTSAWWHPWFIMLTGVRYNFFIQSAVRIAREDIKTCKTLSLIAVKSLSIIDHTAEAALGVSIFWSFFRGTRATRGEKC